MAIELLLTEDVDALGRKGEIVKVKPGYARNFLLPRKMAFMATKNALRRQAALQEERAKQAVIDKKDSEALALKLKEINLETTVKVDPQGHMYGSVSALDLHKMLESEHGIVLGKRDILLKHPLKKVGTYTVNVRLKEDVEATFGIKINGEGYVEPEPVPQPVAEEAPKEEAPSEEAAE